MKSYSDKQYVELFHLLFLVQLGKKVDKAAYALKGGCNLRFFFGSRRYSEDIDIDVQDIPVHKLEERVDGILSSTPFAQILQVRRIGIHHLKSDKQTGTTQRWKLGLTIPRVERPVPTKIEFSRRGMAEERLFGAIDARVTADYEIAPLMVSHYSKNAAFRQKVKALADRRETQARDVFDLYLLAGQGARMTKVDRAARERMERARENVMLVDYRVFKSQVMAYLPVDDQQSYDAQTWDAMRMNVLEALDVEMR